MHRATPDRCGHLVIIAGAYHHAELLGRHVEEEDGDCPNRQRLLENQNSKRQAQRLHATWCSRLSRQCASAADDEAGPKTIPCRRGGGVRRRRRTVDSWTARAAEPATLRQAGHPWVAGTQMRIGANYVRIHAQVMGRPIGPRQLL